MPHASPTRPRTAAMFVDFDNLASILHAQSDHDQAAPEYAAEIFEEVERYLKEGDDTPTIYGRAFGTFDDASSPHSGDALTALYRRSLQPVHVPTDLQDNTAEVRLTIAVTQFLATRPDVETIVLVTGNRPYLPLVRWIQEQGRRPLVAAVNPPQTADSPPLAEDSKYLDARNLLSKPSREDLLSNAPARGAAYTQAQSPSTPPPQKFRALETSAARRAVEIAEKHFGQYDEIYLTPLLRKLSDLMGAEEDPKSLVSDLEAAGAARLEKRNGYPYNYTVLIVNDAHPDVQSVHEELDAEAPDAEATGDAASSSESAEAPPGESDESSRAHDPHEMDAALDAPASAPSPNGDASEAPSETERDA